MSVVSRMGQIASSRMLSWRVNKAVFAEATYRELLRVPGFDGRHFRHMYRRAARSVTYAAIRRGDLVRPDSCEQCGVACTPEGHHVDYDEPLLIEWLCRPCHLKADVRRRARERAAAHAHPHRS